MKDYEHSSSTTASSTITKAKRSAESSDNKGQFCKLWVLGAIILLALWSIFTASITLKWSAGNLNSLSPDFDSSILDDLDVLEVEEREKVVRRMWDVYTQNQKRSTKLPRFWRDAFHAAYEHLISDVPAVRDAAVSEIAKLSLHSLNFHHFPPLQLPSHSNIRGSRKMKQAESGVDAAVGRNQ